MKAYFKIIEAPYDKDKYIISGTDLFYSFVGYTDGSYNVYQSRAFGLTYASYLRMVRDVYGGRLKGKGHKYPTFYFTSQEDAKPLLKELNQRFSFLIG